jgi:serine/threonine protein phosphatase 1
VGWFQAQLGKINGRGRRKAAPRAPDGQVIYAVGDIHGRLDLLNQLLDQIASDVAASRDAAATLAFLGDYVDRGPDSRSVVETLKQLKDNGGERVVTLKGNHEEALLGFLADPSAGAAWVEHGGRETLLSYGVSLPHRPSPEEWEEVREQFASALPQDHLRFFQSLDLFQTRGDYVFVHAGVKPGVPLADQEEHDLLWIRDEFLQSGRLGEKVVVHGHTPVERPAVTNVRIGIDTGAYATGVLTALKLKGEEQCFLQTGG